jgi:hypothetical protein
MIELTFQHDLYDGEAVDEAVKVYGAYASVALARGPSEDIVHVSIGPDHQTPGIDEAMLSAELGNYALGLTIERRSTADAATQEASR